MEAVYAGLFLAEMKSFFGKCDELMWWLMLVGSIKLQVSFAKEPHKRDAILQKRPVILSILLIVATPYELIVLVMVYCGCAVMEAVHIGMHRNHLKIVWSIVDCRYAVREAVCIERTWIQGLYV